MSETNPPVPLMKPGQISRRQAIQWVMATMAASALPRTVFGQGAARVATAAKGYGVDPDLTKIYEPGMLWPLTFTDAQRQTVTALADLIIPKDDLGPAASDVGVPAMIDEWISAPYDNQRNDRPVILSGLEWLEAQSKKGFNQTFAQLTDNQKRSICDKICFTQTAKAEDRQAADFFSRFRNLCASAYYATPEGWKAIGYVGNTPLPRFDGPPTEVLEKLELTQTVS